VSVVANVAINVDSSGAVSKLRQVQQGAQATSQAVDKLNATNNALAASFTKSGKPIQTAANGMRFFTDATGRARKVNGQFVTTAEAAAAGLQKQGKAAQQAGASVSNFGGTVRALLGSFALIQSARFVFAKTAELESQSRSLAILAGSAEKAKQIIQELQQLGAVTPFTSTELIDSAKRLQAFGVEADKVVETTRRLADASGATGAELSGLVTAYGQVQAKGRLQGEELLQFQERGIALQEELRKMYGMTGEEFQKALSKGQVSAKAVEVALANLTSTGGKYANGAIAQSDTLQGRLSTLQDGIDGLARGIGESLSPAIKAVLNEAIFVVNAINSLIATGARAKSFGLGDSQRKQILSQAQTEAQQLVEGRRIKDPFERNRQFQELTAQRERDLIESYGYRTGQVKPTATAPQMAAQTPALLGATSSGGGGGAKKGNDDAKRAAEQMQQQLKAADDINFALKNRLAITQETEAVAKRMIEFDVRQNEIAKEYDELKKAAKSADELALINANLVIEQRIAQIEAERDINELLIQRAALMALVRQAGMPTVYNELEEQDAALQAVLDKYPAIGAAADAAATLATSGISEMIAGTKSAEQVFVEFLSSIADALINTAKQMIAQYIAIGIARMFAGMGGGGGGGFAPSGPLAAVGNINPMPTSFTPFAEGGFVTGPTNAIIGEGGESEYVIPSSKMNAAMSRYGRGARGEGVIAGSGGDTSEAGGNATPVNGAIDVRYTVERINSVEYVTADQFQRGMQQAAMQGAQRGEQQALRQLQQNTSIRGRVGLR
jgi:tape measure domain-containing protein